MAGLLGTAAVSLMLAAGPASAATDLVAIDVNSVGSHLVASTCHITAGETTDVRFITYLVHASAHALGTSVPLATGVECTVYAGGTARGGASGSLPGPDAEAIGTATVPVGDVPTLCVSGGATYLDGATVPTKHCP
jgi:type 1 fimbria pilin